MNRIEKDSLGEKIIPSEALYGIHSVRACENFPSNIPFPVEWYKAAGITKLACYRTIRKFNEAVKSKINTSLPFSRIEDNVLNKMMEAAGEVAEGKHFDNFIVPALQGGAGTSINMNVNEIISNSALLKLGRKCGEYDLIDPTESANLFQSTNDVIPTSLTIAVMRLLNELEKAINNLRKEIEKLEERGKEFLRTGYTQHQAAVPSSFGILFSTYSEALSRDWWRVSKCFERIKQVNLGGGAIGTGIAIPRYFIMSVVPELRELTGLQLAHSENLPDSTSNLDRWVEIHSTLKAHAVNLEKMVSDIRLLSSDLAVNKTISIPEKQVGSSIMPGKINPVIPEFTISAAHTIYANDMLISSLCGQGTLDLNAYLPSIGCALIESLNLLTACNKTLLNNLFSGITINERAGYDSLMKSPSITTALTPFIGYHKAAILAKLIKEDSIDIFEANERLKLIDPQKLRKALEPGNLLKLGFSVDDL